MKRTEYKTNSFLRRNWFQVALGILLITVFIKRDVSIKFSLGTPNASSITKIDEIGKALSPQEAKMLVNSKDKETKNKKIPIAKGSMALANPLDLFHATTATKKEVKAIKKEFLESDYSPEEQDDIRFINRFLEVAAKERDNYGIPVSIKLAQGLVASDSGNAPFALGENNFYGIPCDMGWDGDIEYYGDKCYRKYKTAWMSIRDHSDYITEGPFKYLVKLGTKNYHKWAEGLELSGYSEDPQYAEKLIAVIEKFQLEQYDK